MMLVLFCYSRCVCGVEVCRRVCMPGVVESGEVDMGEEMVLGFRLFLSLFFFKKKLKNKQITIVLLAIFSYRF